MTYKLTIFDLDGTLAPTDQDTLYPDAAAWLEDNPGIIYICTNQGSIGLRHWMEKDGFGDPSRWSTPERFEARISKLFPEPYMTVVLKCYRYQSKTSGLWCPVPVECEGTNEWREDWRKPAPGMLLRAMEIAQATSAQTLMVGDGKADQGAAEATGCDFVPAWAFFGREEKDLI